MGRIVVTEYISVDGVVEAPSGTESFARVGWTDAFSRGPEGDQFKLEETMKSDALLLGRVTYDGFAPVWPTRSGDPYSDRINAMRKYVVSTTLRDPDWNNTEVIDGDVAAAIARLKEEPGQDIVQYGYGEVTRLMLEHGLLDELRLWVHPLILGRGSPADLLFGAVPAVGFHLVDTTALSDGTVILGYRTDKLLA